MKLSGSTFVWLAGIGFVSALGPARAAGTENGTMNLARFDGAVRPDETFRTDSDVLRLRHGRSAAYPRVAFGLWRPDQRRAAGFVMARSAVEAVRIGRTPEPRRAGAVSLNRFVFRRTDSEKAGR